MSAESGQASGYRAAYTSLVDQGAVSRHSPASLGARLGAHAVGACWGFCGVPIATTQRALVQHAGKRLVMTVRLCGCIPRPISRADKATTAD
jgi:hypothetical protein